VDIIFKMDDMTRQGRKTQGHTKQDWLKVDRFMARDSSLSAPSPASVSLDMIPFPRPQFAFRLLSFLSLSLSSSSSGSCVLHENLGPFTIGFSSFLDVLVGKSPYRMLSF